MGPDRTATPGLHGSAEPLTARFDVALLDLDGVVYVGPAAVPGVPAALAEVAAAGMRLAFVTNNAARPPAAVAQHLRELDVPAQPEDVITSAQAAARYLAERLPTGAPVLVVGTTGLHEALTERGLRPVRSADEHPQAVVQGYSPTLDWAQLAEGAVAIRRGAPWVATNLDATVPSPRGPLPGNGALVAAMRAATGVEPVSTGKPDPTMHRESVLRSAAQHPVVVGDRLDTDIEGAAAVGCPSLLVLSGVTDAATLLGARSSRRPTYLSRDASGLLQPHPAVSVEGGAAQCGAWRVDLAPSGNGDGPGRPELRLSRTGHSDAAADDDLDALRALCAAAWAAADASADSATHVDPGRSGSGGRAEAGASSRPHVTGGDDGAAETVRRLGLAG